MYRGKITIARVKSSIRNRLTIKHSQYENRRRLSNRDFSIISNNCWGSFISQKYGLPYRSPTCGLLILGNDYVKFCADLKHYLEQKLKFIPMEKAKYYEIYKEHPFPVALCDDIEIYFMHYPTEEEAAEKWYRRSKRVNWNNIVYKISERENFSEGDMYAFSKLPHKNKIIIGSKQYDEQTIVIEGIHEFYGSEEDLVAQYFDEAAYFNNMIRH